MADKVVGFRIQIKGTPAQQQEIQKLERSISVLSRRRTQLNANERKNLITTRQAAIARANLNLQLRAQRNRLNDLNRSVLANNNALRKNSGFVKGISQGIAGFVTPIGAAVAGFAILSKVIGSAVGIFRDFQKANSNLAAVLGTSRENITRLSDDSKRLGASTAFTAAEVAGLQTEFAKLGFTETQILSATEATLDLAAASGTDLANAAAIAGTTIKAFGAVASDTQRFVDVMAKSFSSSALDIEKFQESMKVAAPAARAVGQTVEETTAQLGTLANAGISGSLAGTALRRTFIELNKSGIDLDVALKRVRNSQDQLSEATKLVGVRAATAFLVLANGTEKTKELQAALEDAAGTAQEMADTQLDNLDGSLTKLSSAWEGLILSVEDGDGALSNVLQSTVDTTTGMLSLVAATNSLDFTKPSQGARQLAEAFKALGLDMSAVLGLLDELDKQRLALATSTAEAIIAKDDEAQLNFIANLEERLKAEQKLQAESITIRGRTISIRTGQERLAGEQSILTIQETLARITELRELAAAESVGLEEEAAELSEKAQKKREKAEAKAQKERERLAALRLELRRKTEDEIVKNIEDTTQRLIAIENLRFSRAQEDANKKFKGEEQLNELLLQQEAQHQVALAKIESDAAEEAVKKEAKRITDLEKRIQEELDLEIEALEARKQARDLDILTQQISEEEKNALFIENEIEFQEELLELKAQFGEDDIQLKIDIEQQKQDLARATADAEIEDFQRVLSGIKTGAKILSTFLKAEENNRLNTFDASAKAQLQVFQGTEEEKVKLEEKLTRQREDIQKDFFRRQKTLSIVQALIDGASAIVKGIAQFGPPPSPAGIAAIAAAAATTAAQVALISSQKFGHGGVSVGPSHAQGGIPFRIGGLAGEMEGGEAIINKRSTRMFRPILSAINRAGGGIAFETGGITPQRLMAQAGTVLPSLNIAGAGSAAVQELTEMSADAFADRLADVVNDQTIEVVESEMTDVQRQVEINESLGEF